MAMRPVDGLGTRRPVPPYSICRAAAAEEAATLVAAAGLPLPGGGGGVRAGSNVTARTLEVQV